MTAHLTKIKNGYEMAISPTARAADAVHAYIVPNKREARKLAATLHAKPWNF